MKTDIIGIAISKSNVRIRLTTERWCHITENHCELAGLSFEVLNTVEFPDLIISGISGELLALKKINKKYLVVIYRETDKAGFIITAFYTSDFKQLFKNRKIIWSKKH